MDNRRRRLANARTRAATQAPDVNRQPPEYIGTRPAGSGNIGLGELGAGADAATPIGTTNVGDIEDGSDRALAGLDSSGDLSRNVVANKVVTTSINDAAVTAPKGSAHFVAMATPALQNSNVVTYAYNGGTGDIDITIAAGSKGAGGTTVSWSGGVVSVPNFNATYNMVAQFGNGIASAATAYLAYSNNTGATNVATNVIVGTVSVVASSSGSGAGGNQIVP